MKTVFGLLFILSAFCGLAHAQQREVVYMIPSDSTQQFYVKRVPVGPVKGMVVLNMNKLSDSAAAYAYHHHILLLGVIPVDDDHYLDNFTGDTLLSRMDAMIAEVARVHQVPKHRIVIGGMSAAGTGAIRYAQYCAGGHSAGGIRPAGVFAVDPPLDYERFWKECTKTIAINYHPAAVAESKMVLAYFSATLGANLYTSLQRYQRASPFCYGAADGGNAYLLNDMAVRVYTEPDVEWWITNRRHDYYGMNAIDAAALVNQLLINGNQRAALITTSGKGYQESGRHPHSWTIVDQLELLHWCESLFNN